MGLIDVIRTALRRDKSETRPALRNRAGGMAWINFGAAAYPGAEVIVGHPVKTVGLTEKGLWRIEPAQHYIVTARTRTSSGNIAEVGARVDIIAISDRLLDPWKEDDGVSDEEVRELYAPDVRTFGKVIWSSKL